MATVRRGLSARVYRARLDTAPKTAATTDEGTPPDNRNARAVMPLETPAKARGRLYAYNGSACASFGRQRQGMGLHKTPLSGSGGDEALVMVRSVLWA